MSGRLQRKSVQSSQRSQRQSVIFSADDIFSYALRIAYLHYLLQPRTRRHVPAPVAPHVTRMSTGGFMDVMADFQRAHSTSVAKQKSKLPKRFVEVLKTRVEQIVTQKDRNVEYTDPLIQRVFARFYNKFMEGGTYRSLAKERRPEDLLLIFYSSSTGELTATKPDGSSKHLADRHVALFVRLMATIVKEQGWSSSNPELVAKLSNLETKLVRHDENLAEETSARGAPAMILAPPDPLSYDVKDMPMVQTVSRVFDMSLEACQDMIDRNRSVWTEKAALQDMKACNTNLSLGTSKTLRSDDFDLDEAYREWAQAEKAELSDLILKLVKVDQDLMKDSAPVSAATRNRPGHSYSVTSYDVQRTGTDLQRASMYVSPSMYSNESSDINAFSAIDEDSPYVYIPPDTRVFFQKVVKACLTADQNVHEEDLHPIQLPDGDPLILLTKASLDLLKECALRWRVPKFSQMVLFLDVIREKYQDQELDIETVGSAFLYFDAEVGAHWNYWTIADQELSRQILSSLHDAALRELYVRLETAFDKKLLSPGPVLWVLDQHVCSHELFVPTPNLENYVEEMKDGLRNKALEVLKDILQSIPQEAEQLDPMHIIDSSNALRKVAEKTSKRFRDPVVDSVDPMKIFVEVTFPKFVDESKHILYDILEVYAGKEEVMDTNDAFQLYEELSGIRSLYLQVFPDTQFAVHIEDIFEPFVKQFLAELDQKVIGWVDGAVQVDALIHHFAEENETDLGPEMTTSSVGDIFRQFNAPLGIIKGLNWQDELQYAQFMTHLAKIFGKGIARYCEILEKLFTSEMDKPTLEQEAQQTQTRQQKWMALAKEAWSNTDKVEPFQFARESCLKLNNIGMVLQQYDKLERSIESERLAEIIAQHIPQAMTRTRKTKYVFTIKIVEAEDLKAMDMSGFSDPYVVLGDEHQKRLAKTRIVYRNLNPRWEESFDITSQGAIWLTATLWDWDTMGDHDCLGRTTLKLDPAHFSDFLPKEIWLDLDTQGRLLIRVSMEGERDDIEFHFGKAFRTLKRTERDMTRQITDKLSAYIHHCLSRNALKSLLSKGYNISAVSSLFSRTGFNARPQSGMSQAPTQEEVEAALLPLTDYFNANFEILNQTLTPTAMTLVMNRLWKEVLVTLEMLLVPTLSDKPSQQRQLTPQETDIVFKWLQMMLDFFHSKDPVTGEVGGVPLEQLKSPKYHELQSLNYFYFEPTIDLIRSSERMANAAAARQQAQRQKPNPTSAVPRMLPGIGAKRSKSVLNKRNLGTMRKVKEEKRREAQAEPNDDMILRILRMRPEATRYLQDRSRQKERLEAAAAAEDIVRKSMQQGPGRMGSLGGPKRR